MTVPKGYRTQVIAAWGESVSGSGAVFSQAASGLDQEKQVGMHHDGMHFFPIAGSSSDGLLAINHEYVEPGSCMHPMRAGPCGPTMSSSRMAFAILITSSRRSTLMACRSFV